MFKNYIITKFKRLSSNKIYHLDRKDLKYSLPGDLHITLESMLEKGECVKSGHFEIIEVKYNNKILKIGTEFKLNSNKTHRYKILNFIYTGKNIKVVSHKRLSPDRTWDEYIDNPNITYITEEKELLPTIQQTYTLNDINKVLSNVLDKVELDMVLDEFKRLSPSNDTNVPQEALKAVKSNKLPTKWAIRLNDLKEGELLRKINNNSIAYNYNAVNDGSYYHFDQDQNMVTDCKSYLLDEYTEVTLREVIIAYKHKLAEEIILPF